MLHVTPEGYSWPTSQGRPFPEGHEFVVVDDFTPEYVAGKQSVNPHGNDLVGLPEGTEYSHRIQQLQVLAYAREVLGFNDAIQFTAHYSDGAKVFRYGVGPIGPRWSESTVGKEETR